MAFFSSPGRHSTWGTRETFFAIPWKCTAFIRMLSGWIWKGVLSDVDWWADAEKHCLLYRVKWQFGNVGTLRGQPSGLLHRVWFSKNFNSLFWKVCGRSALYQSDDVPCNCAHDIYGCTVWCIPDHPAAAAFSYGGLVIVKSLLTKSSVWSYENEWRMISMLPDNTLLCRIYSLKPTAVYIGVRTDEEAANTLYQICCEKDIPCYKMVPTYLSGSF